MANTLSPISGSSAPATPAPASETTDRSKDLTKDMFLKLMVAQLRNQNPLNPSDGTVFLEQLSQISGVEQMVEMRKQLESIKQLLSAATSGTANS
jgi:flagellar basal-body rod modification protein FlgD